MASFRRRRNLRFRNNRRRLRPFARNTTARGVRMNPSRRRRLRSTRNAMRSNSIRANFAQPLIPRNRFINYLGDGAIVKVKDVRWERIFLGATLVNTPSDYSIELPTNNAFYQGVMLPGNYLSSTVIPNLDVYLERFAFAQIVRSSVKAVFTNTHPERIKDVGVMLYPRGSGGQSWSSLPSWSLSVNPQEQPRTTSRTLTPINGSRSTVKILGTATQRSVYGSNVNQTAKDVQLTTGAMTSEPTIGSYHWYVWQGNNFNLPDTVPTNPDNFDGVTVKITLYYTIKFYQRAIEIA